MHRVPRLIKRWLVMMISLGILLSILGFSIPFYLERKIEEKIILANGHVSAVQVDLLTRSIHLRNLDWSEAGSSRTYPDHLSIKNVKVQGVGLLALLFNQHLVIRHLELDNGSIVFNAHNRPTQTASEPVLRFLRINNIAIHALHARVQEDSLTLFSGHLQGEVSRLILERDSIHAPRYSLKSATLEIDTFQYTPRGAEYTTTVQQISIDTKKRQVTLNSLHLTPLYGKYEFANRLGKQRARLNLSIPTLIARGWEWEKMLEKSFAATSVHLQSLKLNSFKDKRLPFLVTEVVPLPMESFAKLAWPIRIDSVFIHSAEITIETFPEHGRTSGILTFNRLNAIFTGLNNRWKTGNARYAVLNAKALLMNAGLIQAQFHFPQDGSEVYTAKGSISKLELTNLNDVLGKMANLRITSGYLQDMTFNFRYTDYVSQGSLDMAYRDLHILGLDKNKASTNQIKTLLIRVFTPRFKSKSVPLSKAVGVIDVQRNRQKFVFNVWWISILDGIHSSILGNGMTSKKKS